MKKESFSKWIKWNERKNDNFYIKNSKQPGVYLIAHFKKPRKKVNPTSRKIICIGETCCNLRERLNAFNRSASDGSDGHGPGKRYWKIFVSNSKERKRKKRNSKERKRKKRNSKERKRKNPMDYLYVAIYPVKKLRNKLHSLYIRYVERKLLWNYARKNSKAPECNKK